MVKLDMYIGFFGSLAGIPRLNNWFTGCSKGVMSSRIPAFYFLQKNLTYSLNRDERCIQVVGSYILMGLHIYNGPFLWNKTVLECTRKFGGEKDQRPETHLSLSTIKIFILGTTVGAVINSFEISKEGEQKRWEKGRLTILRLVNIWDDIWYQIW